MRRATILGGRGFIGSRLATALRTAGVAADVPERDEDLRGRELGTAFYCAGVTSDFRQRPLETMNAHVCALAALLSGSSFDRLVYLSSTRVYRRASTGEESALLPLAPADGESLYDASKIAGETLALSDPRGVVVRLSNVYGGEAEAPTFLASIVRDSLRNGAIQLHSGRGSAKDYVSVGDVVAILPRIAAEGSSRIYNVAGGENVENGELVDRLQALTGCSVAIDGGAQASAYPVISIERLRRELGFQPRRLFDDLPRLVDDCRRIMAQA